MPSLAASKTFVVVAALFQTVFVLCFVLFGRYAPQANAKLAADAPQNLQEFYPMFQDVHVMIFIGFGFLMTFLRRYGYSAVGINFLLAAFVIQWAMIVRGLFKLDEGRFTISIEELLTADFSAAVVLISMGAMLGKLSPVQYLVMGFVETALAVVGEHVVFELFHANDVGGSMVVHAFGAYFGLAVARVMHKDAMVEHEHEGSFYHSDLFSMLGTVFLWIFWPSFNAAVATPADAQHRAVINTYIAMATCCVTAFIVSSLVHARGKFDMVHVQNSTLAGGVAVGTTANLMLQPWGAAIIGVLAGTISVVGFRYITPALASKLGVHDTCGVNNLHGMPAILAGVVGILGAFCATPQFYGDSLSDIFPAMAHNRTAGTQAAYQAAGLGVVLLLAVVGGAFTGLLLKLPVWNQVAERSYFADDDYFGTPDDYDNATKVDVYKHGENAPLNRNDEVL